MPYPRETRRKFEPEGDVAKSAPFFKVEGRPTISISKPTP